MFTYQQIRAIQEHRYGKRHTDGSLPRRTRRESGSLHELITALAAGLASVGLREPGDKVRPASPAY